MRPYCTQNNGDCSTCSLVNYGLDCANNPISTEVPGPIAPATYDGFKGAQTINHIKRLIGPELAERLKNEDYGLVMSAVNRAYHEGKASAGAEMIDDNAVWINKLNRAIEWAEEGAEYEPITEDLDGGRKRTYFKKIRNGKIIPRFTDSESLGKS
jgi:hypothetical protein